MSELLKVERSLGTIEAEIQFYKNQTYAAVLNGAIEIGRRLAEAKALVAHGEWGTWLREKVDFSQSTANNMMRIFEEYGDRQMALFDMTANSQTFGNLSYSKALALLALPEEEREEFVQNNDVEDMSTRQLQDAIKKAKELEEAVHTKETVIEEHVKVIDELIVENTALKKDQKHAINKAIDEIKYASDENKRKLEQDYETAKKDLEKAKKELENAQKVIKAKDSEIEELSEKEDSPELSEEEKQKIKDEAKAEAEAEIARLTKSMEDLKKQMNAAFNPELMQFKFIFDDFQANYNKLSGLIAKVGGTVNEETGSKLKNALITALNTMTEKLGGISFEVKN